MTGQLCVCRYLAGALQDNEHQGTSPGLQRAPRDGALWEDTDTGCDDS